MDQDYIKNLMYMTRPELRDEIYRLREELRILKCKQDSQQIPATDAKQNTSQIGNTSKQEQ